MAPPRVLIFGTGSVGCIYAYVLSKSSASVTAVCRSNYEAIKKNGITIDSAIWGQVHARPAVVRSLAEAAKESWDYILVSVKAFPGTPELLQEVVGASTSIILAQNGIGIEEEYAKAFPSNPIISGVVYLPTTQTQPGIIKMGNIERLLIGTWPKDAPTAAKQRVEEFAKLFEEAGARIEVCDDVQSERWSKLIVNGSWNPICALTRSSDANFLRSSPSDAETFIVDVMMEIVAIAQALGYKEVNKATVDYQVGRAIARLDGEGIEPSMLADVKNKQPLEVEAILGNTVRIAKGKKVQTSKLDMLYILTRGLNASISRGD